MTLTPDVTAIPEDPTENYSLKPASKLILIVDDLPENLQVLAGHLKELNYEVLAANSGARALALVQNKKPDLILLDIIMPHMDGFEVCRRLKEDPEVRDIPVIFITARTETEDILTGFQLGAVDYVTKPFRSAELFARVRAHLEIKASRDLFATYNKQLERLSKNLRRLNEDKNRFLSIVSHDIRGAFGNVISISRILTEEDSMEPDEATALLTDIAIEAEHMIALAENLLNIEAIERREVCLKRERVETRPLFDFAMQAHQIASQAKGLIFEMECDGSEVDGDLTACRQIASNLLSNAVKYSLPGSRVWLTVKAHANKVLLTVRDEGPGITREDQQQLFVPFARLGSKTAANEHSVGLGLSIVKLMCEFMSGSVFCESEFGHGATFTVSLPKA